jgi:hypothetical protein
MSMRSLDEQFTQGQRETAFTDATKLLQLNVIEFSVEDVIVVADWLLTGEANIGLKFSKQYSENYERSKEMR